MKSCSREVMRSSCGYQLEARAAERAATGQASWVVDGAENCGRDAEAEPSPLPSAADLLLTCMGARPLRMRAAWMVPLTLGVSKKLRANASGQLYGLFLYYAAQTHSTSTNVAFFPPSSLAQR